MPTMTLPETRWPIFDYNPFLVHTSCAVACMDTQLGAFRGNGCVMEVNDII